MNLQSALIQGCVESSGMLSLVHMRAKITPPPPTPPPPLPPIHLCLIIQSFSIFHHYNATANSQQSNGLDQLCTSNL